MGHALRLAEALGARVLFVGTGPRPDLEPDLDKFFRRWRSVPWQLCAGLPELLRELRARRAYPIAIEVTEQAVSYQSLRLRTPRPLALIVGSEDYGIDEALLRAVPDHVFIPMAGRSSCLGAGMALAVVAYHFAYVYQDRG